MQVLFVASECAPLVTTGGLAEVVGALARALRPLGVRARVLTPGYPAVMAALLPDAVQSEIGGGMRLVAGEARGLDLIALDAPALFDRPGNPYLGPDGRDWPDNAQRFGALCRAAARVAHDGAFGWRPALVHVHDWQAGLVPTMIRQEEGDTPSVLTIHNMAFQGLFPPGVLEDLGLPPERFVPEGFEFWGQLGFLKAGLVDADRITTVSPTYARELAWPDYGMGLEGVIAGRRAALRGILNGVDLDGWDPATDRHIAATYSADRPEPRAENRRALIERFALDPDGTGPIFAAVTRLTRQKGIDLLIEALPRLVARDARLALLGAGDAELEEAIREAAAAWPGRVGAVIGWDAPLSRQMLAGADAVLMPSRFEPCGLTQLSGLRYGAVPVVARTGGLADTVIDLNPAAQAAGCGTGVQHAPDSAAALGDAIDRAADAFAEPEVWAGLVRRAMRHPVGWDRSAQAYLDLYRELVENTA